MMCKTIVADCICKLPVSNVVPFAESSNGAVGWSMIGAVAFVFGAAKSSIG